MVPQRPGLSGRPGCVRSSAWIWLFSSIDSTTACARGSRRLDHQMTDASPGHAASIMMKALNWAYDRASTSIPTLGTAEDLAKSHLARRPVSPEKAIDD